MLVRKADIIQGMDPLVMVRVEWLSQSLVLGRAQGPRLVV